MPYGSCILSRYQVWAAKADGSGAPTVFSNRGCRRPEGEDAISITHSDHRSPRRPVTPTSGKPPSRRAEAVAHTRGQKGFLAGASVQPSDGRTVDPVLTDEAGTAGKDGNSRARKPRKKKESPGDE